jgi:O-antigen ligase
LRRATQSTDTEQELMLFCPQWRCARFWWDQAGLVSTVADERNRLMRLVGIDAGRRCSLNEVDAASVLFAAFLVSIFLLGGALANGIAMLSFVAAWVLIALEARSGALPAVRVDPIILAFLGAISVRLALPPYGDSGVIPGAAITRALLLVGLYGLTLLAYARLPFRHILWLIAGIAFTCALIALLIYGYQPPKDKRLTFLGKASHSILGAGAIGTGLIAAVALLMNGPRQSRAVPIGLGLMIAVLGLSIYLTGSRGPLLALAFALVATPIVLWSGSRLLLVACTFGAWAFVTSAVLLEAPLKQALCPTIKFACRDSQRHDVWMASIDTVTQHPLWGVGYGFRFEGVPHAHNAYLGIALHYGLIILILFCWVVVRAVRNTAAMADRQEKFFVAATLIFASGVMGSDLSDPMRFFHTHYVFLWLPIFLGTLASGMERSRKLSDELPHTKF